MTLEEVGKRLIAEKNFQDLYILSRYYYREGISFLDDPSYDRIHKVFVEKGILPHYTNRVYDDDPIPYEILGKYGLEVLGDGGRSGKDNPFYEELVSDPSYSIRPITMYEEMWEYLSSVRDEWLVWMIKMNGVYIRNKIKKGLKLTLSRGRGEGEPWDATNQMRLVIGSPSSKIEEARINGEAYVEPQVLKQLALKYDGHKPESERRFKSAKSGAIVMLRRAMEQEDYKFLKFKVFSASGLGTESISETLELCKELGFDTVPYMRIHGSEIPNTFDEFLPWARQHLDNMRELQGDIPADGVVIDVDRYDYIPHVNNQYQSRNIAVKLEHWSSEWYVGVLKKIHEEQQGVVCSYRLEIENLVTNDNTTARFINGFNPRIIMDEGLVEGARVYFERNSEAVNNLLYGNKNPHRRRNN